MSNSKPEQVGGRYTPDRERAELPCGSLWEATDAEGGRVLLLLCKPGTEDADAKVKAAIQAGERVASPHVVGWNDGGATDDGAIWLVAPWQGSSSFSEYVSRCDGLAPS